MNGSTAVDVVPGADALDPVPSLDPADGDAQTQKRPPAPIVLPPNDDDVVLTPEELQFVDSLSAFVRLQIEAQTLETRAENRKLEQWAATFDRLLSNELVQLEEVFLPQLRQLLQGAVANSNNTAVLEQRIQEALVRIDDYADMLSFRERSQQIQDDMVVEMRTVNEPRLVNASTFTSIFFERVVELTRAYSETLAPQLDERDGLADDVPPPEREQFSSGCANVDPVRRALERQAQFSTLLEDMLDVPASRVLDYDRWIQQDDHDALRAAASTNGYVAKSVLYADTLGTSLQPDRVRSVFGTNQQRDSALPTKRARLQNAFVGGEQAQQIGLLLDNLKPSQQLYVLGTFGVVRTFFVSSLRTLGVLLQIIGRERGRELLITIVVTAGIASRDALNELDVQAIVERALEEATDTEKLNALVEQIRANGADALLERFTSVTDALYKQVGALGQYAQSVWGELQPPDAARVPDEVLKDLSVAAPSASTVATEIRQSFRELANATVAAPSVEQQTQALGDLRTALQGVAELTTANETLVEEVRSAGLGVANYPRALVADTQGILRAFAIEDQDENLSSLFQVSAAAANQTSCAFEAAATDTLPLEEGAAQTLDLAQKAANLVENEYNALANEYMSNGTNVTDALQDTQFGQFHDLRKIFTDFSAANATSQSLAGSATASANDVSAERFRLLFRRALRNVRQLLADNYIEQARQVMGTLRFVSLLSTLAQDAVLDRFVGDGPNSTFKTLLRRYDRFSAKTKSLVSRLLGINRAKQSEQRAPSIVERLSRRAAQFAGQVGESVSTLFLSLFRKRTASNWWLGMSLVAAQVMISGPATPLVQGSALAYDAFQFYKNWQATLTDLNETRRQVREQRVQSEKRKARAQKSKTRRRREDTKLRVRRQVRTRRSTDSSSSASTTAAQSRRRQRTEEELPSQEADKEDDVNAYLDSLKLE